MILPWKEFQIDLASFGQFLLLEIPKADGIVANEDYFEIIELEPFTSLDVTKINDYLDNLDPEIELRKIQRPYIIEQNIVMIKSQALEKPYYSLSALEKKLLFKVTLSDVEIEEVYHWAD